MMEQPWARWQHFQWEVDGTRWRHHGRLRRTYGGQAMPHFGTTISTFGNNIGGQWVAHIGTTMSSLAASSVGNVWHMLAPPWVVDGTS